METANKTEHDIEERLTEEELRIKLIDHYESLYKRPLSGDVHYFRMWEYDRETFVEGGIYAYYNLK